MALNAAMRHTEKAVGMEGVESGFAGNRSSWRLTR
jgi:hypothetical protein